MNKEIFRILKEINSLHHKSLDLQAQIELENQRVEKVEQRLKLTEEELSELNEKLSLHKQGLRKNETELEQTLALQEKTQANINQAQTEKELDSLKRQLETAETRIGELNEVIFQQLEELENLESGQADLKQFIQGAPAGMAEIQQDIDLENQPRLQQKEQYLSRSEALMKDLPPEIAAKISKLLNLPKSAVTKLNAQNYCDFCGSQIPAPKAKSLEANLDIVSCGGCSRIIIPLSSEYL